MTITIQYKLDKSALYTMEVSEELNFQDVLNLINEEKNLELKTIYSKGFCAYMDPDDSILDWVSDTDGINILYISDQENIDLDLFEDKKEHEFDEENEADTQNSESDPDEKENIQPEAIKNTVNDEDNDKPLFEGQNDTEEEEQKLNANEANDEVQNTEVKTIENVSGQPETIDFKEEEDENDDKRNSEDKDEEEQEQGEDENNAETQKAEVTADDNASDQPETINFKEEEESSENKDEAEQEQGEDEHNAETQKAEVTADDNAIDQPETINSKEEEEESSENKDEAEHEQGEDESNAETQKAEVTADGNDIGQPVAINNEEDGEQKGDEQTNGKQIEEEEEELDSDGGDAKMQNEEEAASENVSSKPESIGNEVEQFVEEEEMDDDEHVSEDNENDGDKEEGQKLDENDSNTEIKAREVTIDLGTNGEPETVDNEDKEQNGDEQIDEKQFVEEEEMDDDEHISEDNENDGDKEEGKKLDENDTTSEIKSREITIDASDQNDEQKVDENDTTSEIKSREITIDASDQNDEQKVDENDSEGENDDHQNLTTQEDDLAVRSSPNIIDDLRAKGLNVDYDLIEQQIATQDAAGLIQYLHDNCDMETTSEMFNFFYEKVPDMYPSLCEEGVLVKNPVAYHKAALSLISKADENNEDDKEKAKEDYKKAKFYLEESIKQGFDLSYFSLAKLLSSHYGKVNGAFNMAREGARKGEKYSKCLLGYFFVHGIGTKKDIKRGFSMMLESGADDLLAQYATEIGLYYAQQAVRSQERTQFQNEKNVNRDEIARLFNEAYNWLEKAYKTKKTAASIHNYGICFLKGYHVEKDLQKAQEIFTEGAEKGDAKSMYHLAFILEQADPDKSLQYYQRSASLGCREAQIYLSKNSNK